MLSLVGFAQVHAAPADFNKQVSTHTESAQEQGQVELQPQKKERPAKSVKKKQAKPQVKQETSQPVRQAPQPVPQYAVGCEHYRKLVAQYNWNVEVAMAVMFAESGCNPAAANWSDNHGVCIGSFGLFQISCHGGRIHDPAQNVAAAWGKYQANGWQPWSVCTTGKVNCY